MRVVFTYIAYAFFLHTYAFAETKPDVKQEIDASSQIIGKWKQLQGYELEKPKHPVTIELGKGKLKTTEHNGEKWDLDYKVKDNKDSESIILIVPNYIGVQHFRVWVKKDILHMLLIHPRSNKGKEADKLKTLKFKKLPS
jgi:hypothetical protein